MNIEAQKFEIQKTREHLTALKENIAEWETKLANDEKKLQELESKYPWKPKAREDYYFLDAAGDTDWTLWQNSETDNMRFKIGNCFRTESEPEVRRDFMQLLTQNNLWERLQEEIPLRLELEAIAKEQNFDFRLMMNFLWDKRPGSVNTERLHGRFGDRLNILFQPLNATPNAK